ncbi:hypothetical protein DFH11DRAFT_1590984 [Phellopilus nigrolimitatus]|nr:hypothetical protein DFH11DRAFT_1590984 [Phellopilus nigrolimitatus]
MLAIRAASFRRTPALTARAVRAYTDGAVARSKEFSKKEKAHEDQFIKEHERAQIKKLRDQIEAKKAELEALEKEHAETLQKDK